MLQPTEAGMHCNGCVLPGDWGGGTDCMGVAVVVSIALRFFKTASTSKDDAAISLHDDLLDDLATLAEQRM